MEARRLGECRLSRCSRSVSGGCLVHFHREPAVPKFNDDHDPEQHERGERTGGDQRVRGPRGGFCIDPAVRCDFPEPIDSSVCLNSIRLSQCGSFTRGEAGAADGTGATTGAEGATGRTTFNGPDWTGAAGLKKGVSAGRLRRGFETGGAALWPSFSTRGRPIQRGLPDAPDSTGGRPSRSELVRGQ